MSGTYETIGKAIYDYMDDLDISPALMDPEIEPDPDLEEEEAEDAPTPGWGTKLNRPPKADELRAYPAFAVTPARDGQDTGDSDTDFDAINYHVWIIVSNREATVSEEQLRRIVDIVRPEFRKLRDDASPLHEAAYNITFTGEWGGTPDQGERWYRLEVTTFVHETLLTTTP